MELSHLQNISVALCLSLPLCFFPSCVGHWVERGTLHLHAPQRQPVSGHGGPPHSPHLAGSPEVEWVFTLQEPRVLTLPLTSFTVSMSPFTFSGIHSLVSFLFPPHLCPLCRSLCLSFCLCLLLCLSFTRCCSLPPRLNSADHCCCFWNFNWLLVSPPVHSVPSFLLSLFNFLSTMMEFNTTLTCALTGLPFLCFSICSFSSLLFFFFLSS